MHPSWRHCWKIFQSTVWKKELEELVVMKEQRLEIPTIWWDTLKFPKRFHKKSLEQKHTVPVPSWKIHWSSFFYYPNICSYLQRCNPENTRCSWRRHKLLQIWRSWCLYDKTFDQPMKMQNVWHYCYLFISYRCSVTLFGLSSSLGVPRFKMYCFL